MRVRGPSIKKFLPRSLFGRSLLILIIPVLLVQVIATYVFFDRHWDKITSKMGYAVAGEITVIGKAIEQDPSADNVSRMAGYAAQNLGIFVDFKRGEKIRDEKDFYGRSLWYSGAIRAVAYELQGRLHKPIVVRADFDEKWVRIKVGLDSGLLDVTVPQRRLYTSSGYIFLLWMVGSSVILLVIAVLFMRNQIRPIRKLAIAADRFGKGREVPFFKPEGASEVRQAGQAFLDMHRRIRRQIEQRTTMLAGVSHDLRTPLTRLKLQMAMLGDSPDVEAMKTDVAQMEQMIAGYLDFVRGEGDEQASMVDVGQLLGKTAVSSRRQGVEVTTDVPREIHAMLRPLSFERALMNLVNNAGKYAKHVWMSATLDEDRKLEIIIDDNGPGIPEDKFEDVFRPFYRVDESRNVATGGVGLGLPIAMDIVHSHGGKIWLEKSPRGGLRVMIRVPV